MNTIKSIFKRPDGISKLFYWFMWFTIFSFIVGIVIKGIVAGWEIWMVSDSLPHQKDLYDAALSNMVTQQHMTHEAAIAIIGEGIKTANYIEAYTGLGLQLLIVALTVVIYPLSLRKIFKIHKGKEKLTPKAYKTLRTENIIFLVVFLILDLTAIGIVVVEKAPMEGWVLFTIISIIIPTPLVIGSLVWLRKLKTTNHIVLAK